MTLLVLDRRTSLTQHHLQLFSLSDQIQHKVDFLDKQMLLPGRPPIVIFGHSIGEFTSPCNPARILNYLWWQSAAQKAQACVFMQALTWQRTQ